MVFSFGGDGTAREVAAGLLGGPAALGVLPGGTANLLALALGLPRDPVAAAAVLRGLPPRPFDVGLAGGVPFLMMVSAGLDAAMLASLDTRLKWRFGKPAILGQGLREWWRYPYPALEVTVDGERLEATFVSVSNIPYYAGAFRLAPEARTGRRPASSWCSSGAAAAPPPSRSPSTCCAPPTSAGATSRSAGSREVLLAGPAGALAQVDGDVCQERLPLTVRLAPERLLVLAPDPVPGVRQSCHERCPIDKGGVDAEEADADGRRRRNADRAGLPGARDVPARRPEDARLVRRRRVRGAPCRG